MGPTVTGLVTTISVQTGMDLGGIGLLATTPGWLTVPQENIIVALMALAIWLEITLQSMMVQLSASCASSCLVIIVIRRTQEQKL